MRKPASSPLSPHCSSSPAAATPHTSRPKPHAAQHHPPLAHDARALRAARLHRSLHRQIEHGGKKGPRCSRPRSSTTCATPSSARTGTSLDRFPGWTMAEINPTVRVAGHVAGKDDKLERRPPQAAPRRADQHRDKLSHLPRPRPLRARQTPKPVSPRQALRLPAFTTEGIVTDLGDGVTRGDGPNPLAPEHAESPTPRRRTQPPRCKRATKRPSPHPALFLATTDRTTPEGADRTLSLDDRPHRHRHRHPLLRQLRPPPLQRPGRHDALLDQPRIIIPGSRCRPLLVPVSHAEYEWHIRGPLLNADVSYLLRHRRQSRVAHHGQARPGLGHEARRPHLHRRPRRRSHAPRRRTHRRLHAPAPAHPPSPSAATTPSASARTSSPPSN